MQWISYFFTFNIPFYIYKLKTSDSILENNKNKKEQSIIVLSGIIYITQVFSNEEVLPITVLQKNDIIDMNNSSINIKSYYKISALKETYLIRFSSIDIYNIKMTNHFFKYYLTHYKMTLYNQKIMHYILIQKNTHYRIIQLIILLSIQCGIINQEFIQIPFKMRKRDIAIMTGTSINAINKVFQILQVKKIIKYSKNKLIFIQKRFFIHFIYLLS